MVYHNKCITKRNPREPSLCPHGANSLRYASKKHWGQITKAMRAIYTAPTVQAAETLFEAFSENREDTYPAMIRSEMSHGLDAGRLHLGYLLSIICSMDLRSCCRRNC